MALNPLHVLVGGALVLVILLGFILDFVFAPKKAASTPAAPAEDETAAGAMSTYEMRKFLQQSQRFFLSVNKDAAFAQPSHSAEGKPMNRARAGLA